EGVQGQGSLLFLFQVPRPSLSLLPSQGLEVGSNVTLRCHLPRPAAWVSLHQEGVWTLSRYIDKEQDMAEFSFPSIMRKHAGTYWCQYEVSGYEDISARSDPVDLVLTDHSFPPPNVSLHPEERVGTGTNVTIRCWNEDYGATFLLH
ncbi:T-cell-interacting, activating receptor on myeloid cells protein 1-like, partial [Phasianus colchicus]|uniref:T-cell-interacting, activating receptor on myeloid cells protein 1-like n=1 Tax=Phasianus colchicus TaxID=9054 RepID=UPI00129EDC97